MAGSWCDDTEEPEASNQSRRPKTSRSCRAGLIFPVSRIDRFLRNGDYAERIGSGASVYMAAVLQYLIYDIVDIAGNAATSDNKRRIAPKHLQSAINNDSELHILLGGVVLPQVRPVRKKPSATSSRRGRGKKSCKSVRAQNAVAA